MAKPHYTAEQIRQIKDLLAAQTGGAAPGAGGLLNKIKGMKGLKGGIAELIGYMALSSILGARGQQKERDIQMGAMEEQAKLATPENLYYQAALPQAQQEEEMARNALFSQISGGVIGPSLARGERLIGG